MKIYINEIQLDILHSLLTEAKYQDVVKKVKPGDELRIVDKSNNELLFNVLLNDNGQLFLKSLSNNSIYVNDFFFMDLGALNKDMLTLKRVNTPSDLRDEKDDLKRLKKVKDKYPVNTWKNLTFKTINQMYLDYEEIDIDKTNTKQKESLNNYTQVTDAGEINDLLSDFNSFKEGSKYNFYLIDGGSIWTELITNQGGSLMFEVMPQGLMGSATNYKDLVDAQIRLDVNSKNIKKFEYYDDETYETMVYYDITFKSLLGGEGKGSEKPVTVKYIKDINVVTKSEKKKDEKKKEKKKPDIDSMSVEDITNLVINDPTLQKAFSYKGFIDKLIGGKGKGISTAKKILNKYFNLKYSDTDTTKNIKQLSDKFKTGQLYEIKIQDKSFKHADVEIDILNTYILKAFKQTTTSGEQRPYLRGDGYVLKINSKIGDSNDYRVTIIVNSDNYEVNRTMRITNLY
jgi:hypothetical protein